jgi:hypothetical protein
MTGVIEIKAELHVHHVLSNELPSGKAKVNHSSEALYRISNRIVSIPVKHPVAQPDKKSLETKL